MLDKNGFQKKTYSEIVDEIEEKAKEKFGEDTNTKAFTPLGIILRILAWFFAIVWDNIERVYNSRFIKKSEGVILDFHGGDRGIKRDPATYSYVTLEFTGEPGYSIETETQFTTNSDIYFMLIEDVTLDENGKGRGQAVSIEPGAMYNVAANTITEQAEPVEEIYTVTNPEASAGGTDQEEDVYYKSRLLQANEGGGKSTANAVKSALLNTPGVRAANAIFNKTMQTDADGNPPKSVHAYVLGGTREDVAQSLFDSVSGTSQTVGAQAVEVTDIAGDKHIMRFDYAEEVPIFVRIQIVATPEFETDGVEQIKDNIIEKIGGTNASGIVRNGLSMGQPVILSQLFYSVGKVNGINDVIIQIGKSWDSLIENNITISKYQVAYTSVDNIEVIVNAT
ncbi:baseplate J/gp47 family protein [Heyndrickxia sporothermodurans]